MTRDLKRAYVLSTLVAVLMAVESAGGLLFPALFRDNAFVVTTWRATDLVTLVVALPLLAIGLSLEMRGSLKGRLLWLAMLAYALYGYAFYLFGAAFNRFFLIYVALVGLSLYALVLSVPRIDVAGMASRLRLSDAARWFVVAYMAIVALGLGVLWTAMSLQMVFAGTVPAPILQTGHVTGVVFALDLTLIVPAMALGALWLAKRRPWGYLLGAVLSIKGAVYTLALSVSTVWVMRTNVLPGAGGELPLWGGLTVLGAIAAALMLVAARRGE